MDEKEELKKELEQELQWVQYRTKMLDLIELKLLEMRELAERATNQNLDDTEREAIQKKLKELESQVNGLDSESKR